jgi:transposase
MAGVLRGEPSLEAVSPAEVTLLEQPLETVAVGRPGKPGRPRKRPEGLIADLECDRKPLRARLSCRGIEPIIPTRRNHTSAPPRDGRKLRRDRRRWIIERTFAWLGHFRYLVVRSERLLTTYAGVLHLAWALLTSRKRVHHDLGYTVPSTTGGTAHVTVWRYPHS